MIHGERKRYRETEKEIYNDKDTEMFIVDTMRRRDRGNDGMSLRDSADMLHDLGEGPTAGLPPARVEKITKGVKEIKMPGAHNV